MWDSLYTDNTILGTVPDFANTERDSGYILFTGGEPICGESKPDIDNTLEGTADSANTICSILWKSREVSLHLYQRNVLYTIYVYTQSLFCLKYSRNVHSNRKT